jgi:hypothetical protein
MSAEIIELKQQNTEAYVQELAQTVEQAVGEIRRVNENTRMLALNARIEAARAGAHGAAFGVVASEMQDLSMKTTHVANDLATTTKEKIQELLELIGGQIRGERLSDLARTNIDLIDRCLYERTCDVRWWATDSSLTDAVERNGSDDFAFASQRMGVILDAYTVYHDLVLCNADGKIVANGRPNKYNVVGNSVQNASWFNQAMRTSTGNEYGFQTSLYCDLVKGQPSLIYSCTVRKDGRADGKVLGVLGVVFNWQSLAVPILQNVPIAEEERAITDCLIVDGSGQVLASQLGCDDNQTVRLVEFDKIMGKDKGFFVADYKGDSCCVAHAKAPGFETYSTGWYSLMIQRV